MSAPVPLAGRHRVRVGTAGWSIPRALGDRFAGAGTHLQRYAGVLSGVEINSSFYRPHAAATYARWAAATPPHFRFAVKVPRLITHEHKLRAARQPLERFLAETSGLGEKRGPLLVQLPPSFAFDARVTARFFELLRAQHDGPVVCEPRHATWFAPRPDALLARYQVARVAADPARAPGAERPGGWPGLVYVRWHGSPRIYWSTYEEAALDALAAALRAVPDAVPAWCVFDNTATGAALANACDLQTRLAGRAAW